MYLIALWLTMAPTPSKVLFTVYNVCIDNKKTADQGCQEKASQWTH